jgi:transcriptional regulator with XRE-family HTH domain
MKGDLEQILAANLVAYRMEHSMSQEELEHRAGVHRTYMQRLETAKQSATLRTVDNIAESLGIDPLDLLRPTN